MSRSFSLIETTIACGILVILSASIAAIGLVSTHGVIVAKHRAEAQMIAEDAITSFVALRERNYYKYRITVANSWSSDFINLKDNYLNKYCIFLKQDESQPSPIRTADCSTAAQYGEIKFTRQVSLVEGGLKNTGATGIEGDDNFIIINNKACEDVSMVTNPLPFQCNSYLQRIDNRLNKIYLVKVKVSFEDYGQNNEVILSTIISDYHRDY